MEGEQSRRKISSLKRGNSRIPVNFENQSLYIVTCSLKQAVSGFIPRTSTMEQLRISSCALSIVPGTFHFSQINCPLLRDKARRRKIFPFHSFRTYIILFVPLFPPRKIICTTGRRTAPFCPKLLVAAACPASMIQTGFNIENDENLTYTLWCILQASKIVISQLIL